MLEREQLLYGLLLHFPNVARWGNYCVLPHFNNVSAKSVHLYEHADSSSTADAFHVTRDQGRRGWVEPKGWESSFHLGGSRWLDDSSHFASA